MIPGVAFDRGPQPFDGVGVIIKQHVVEAKNLQIVRRRRSDRGGARVNSQRIRWPVFAMQNKAEQVQRFGRIGMKRQIAAQRFLGAREIREMNQGLALVDQRLRCARRSGLGARK